MIICIRPEGRPVISTAVMVVVVMVMGETISSQRLLRPELSTSATRGA
jgi:hypothetical protein